jgi:hypothetical protein
MVTCTKESAPASLKVMQRDLPCVLQLFELFSYVVDCSYIGQHCSSLPSSQVILNCLLTFIYRVASSVFCILMHCQRGSMDQCIVSLSGHVPHSSVLKARHHPPSKGVFRGEYHNMTAAHIHMVWHVRQPAQR